jgi:hypothetical protein
MAWAAKLAVGVALMEAALVTLGCGFGFVMPNLTVAIQNSVARSDLGVATSASAFLRSLGGALGVAISGAVVTARLGVLLPARFTTLTTTGGAGPQSGIQQMARLNPATHHLITEAYRHAIATTFFTGSGIAALAFVLVLFLPEHPLRDRPAEADVAS